MHAISVVIPTFNAGSFIGETLASVFAQTRLPREVIVVDDASSDGTPDLVQAMVEKSPVRLLLVRLQVTSGGPATPVNVGISHSASSYVSLCEQDDRMLPQKLEMLSKCVSYEPALGLVISRYRVVGDNSPEIRDSVQDDTYSQFESMPKRHLGGPFYYFESRAAYRAALERCYAVSLSNMLISKEAWASLGGLDECIRAVADHDFLLRLSRKYLIGWVDEPLWEYRRHRASLVRSTPACRFAEDYGRIWLRQLKVSACPEERAAVSGLLRQNRLDRAYHDREASKYISSLAWYGRSIWETGPSVAAAVGIAKLFPHFLVRRFVSYGTKRSGGLRV
ncbi:MAG: glycosyltransferase [Deltaproteobacteria bacterium]|nr:glycosyltransferase [Deltaproteobacteria bacterium]